MTMVPKKCNMPSLYPELTRLDPQLLLLSAFIGNGTLSKNAGLIRRNLVRLVDKAIIEYTLARQAILDQIAESERPYEEMLKGRIIYMFGFTNHMENCLNAVRRVIGLLDALRSDNSAPAQDRIKRRLLDAHVAPLIEIRNVLEHMGSAVDADEIQDGHAVILSLGSDESSVCIGAHSISFSSLATIIKAIHSEARRLLEEPHAQGAA